MRNAKREDPAVKRIFALLLCLALAVGAAACSGQRSSAPEETAVLTLVHDLP